MGGIPDLLVRRDVAEDEHVEALVASNGSVDGGNGEKNNPGDEPDRDKHSDDHTQKADEEVGIHAILGPDLLVVGVIDGDGPLKDTPFIVIIGQIRYTVTVGWKL